MIKLTSLLAALFLFIGMEAASASTYEVGVSVEGSDPAVSFTGSEEDMLADIYSNCLKRWIPQDPSDWIFDDRRRSLAEEGEDQHRDLQNQCNPSLCPWISWHCSCIPCNTGCRRNRNLRVRIERQLKVKEFEDSVEEAEDCVQDQIKVALDAGTLVNVKASARIKYIKH